MDEMYRQLLITLRGMWRYRWLGLTAAWVLAAIAILIIVFIPDKYEASTRIYVNTASILKPLMTGLTVQPNDEQRIAMLSRIVISRPNVEKLVQMVGLDAGTKSKEESERRVDEVTKMLAITSTGRETRENLYTLTFRDPDPARAKRVVQLFASMFIESGAGSKASDTDSAKKFIEEQIAVYEKKLLEAESKLKDFKLRNLGMAPGEGAGFFARVAEASSQLSKAQLELREAENSRLALKRGLANEDPFSAAASSGQTSTGTAILDIDARLDALRRSLDAMLLRYTDVHPDVIGTQRAIKELTEQRRVLIASGKRDGVPLPQYSGSGPRASEQLKVSLAQAEATVASLRARVAEYSVRHNQLKASATQMPQLEAEYIQLNRDYEINKKNYESLVSRRESASISGDMQAVSGVADFRQIDPPRVSPAPISPNRRLLFPLALLGALAAGFAVAFIAKELRPAFYDGKALAESTGLPVLGAVSMIMNAAKRSDERRMVIKFVGNLAVLIGVYSVVSLTVTFMAVRAA